MSISNIENKENASETKDVFKTPMQRDTIRRVGDIVKNTPETVGTPIRRASTITRAKPLLRTPSVKIVTEKTTHKEIHDLSEKFLSKASLSSITDDYFNNCSGGKKAPKASNKTMASLGDHRLTPEQATKLFGKLDPPFCNAEIAERLEKIKRDTFPRIMVHLQAGYNILLYGFGSKMKILDNFHQKYLSSENSIVVPGFSADVNIQAVLTRIIDAYMRNVAISSRSVQGMSEAIRDYFNNRVADKLYIVVHNIDGLALRNSSNIFSILTQSKGIQIIASVDHIHSGMMWTQNKIDYLWHDCTTVEPYSKETRIDNARLMSDKTNRGMASLLAVVDSLNDQAKKVFLHLAQYQLSQGRQSMDGMLLDNLYAVCKDNLLVSSELDLRNRLIEFRDHRLVHIKQGLDRSDYIKILLDTASIKDFVDKFADLN